MNNISYKFLNVKMNVDTKRKRLKITAKNNSQLFFKAFINEIYCFSLFRF